MTSWYPKNPTTAASTAILQALIANVAMEVPWRLVGVATTAFSVENPKSHGSSLVGYTLVTLLVMLVHLPPIMYLTDI